MLPIVTKDCHKKSSKQAPKEDFFPLVIIYLSEQVNNYVLLTATQPSFLAEMYVE